MSKKAFIQTAILLLTSASIVFVNIPGYMLIGQIFGVCSQPFWFYETWKQKQWGMFLNTVVICGAWIYGMVSI